MSKGKSLSLSFLVMIVIFAITHFARFPGSLQDVMANNGGRKILDMQASFSADEIYARLDAFGSSGRAAYLQMIFTVDLVFPIALFTFLILLARFVSERIDRPVFKWIFVGAPILYFVSDMMENLIILALLWNYPERLDALAGVIGYVTLLKRAGLLASLALPLLTLALRSVRVAQRRKHA